MRLIDVLQKVVSEMETILDRYDYDEEIACQDQKYMELKIISDKISEAEREAETGRILNQSILFADEPNVSDEPLTYLERSCLQKLDEKYGTNFVKEKETPKA